MNLYKIFLSKDGTKKFLEEINNETLSVLKSYESDEEYKPLSNEQTLSIIDNLDQIMENKKNMGMVSENTVLDFDLYKQCIPNEKSKTL